jgi:hypothetical protein
MSKYCQGCRSIYQAVDINEYCDWITFNKKGK